MGFLEFGMRMIDGYPYYPMIDLMIFTIAILAVVCIVLCMINRDQKAKIEELQNLVDYYYYEDLVK